MTVKLVKESVAARRKIRLRSLSRSVRSAEYDCRDRSLVRRIGAALLDRAWAGAFDMQRRILLWNKRSEELFGWTEAEAVGKDFGRLLRAQFPKPVPELLSELLRDGRWRGAVVTKHRDGREMTFMTEWKLVAVGKEAPVVLAWFSEITELARTREAISTVQANLREVNTRFVKDLDEDRTRIARELHDHAGQALTAAKLVLHQVGTLLVSSAASRSLCLQLKRAIAAIDGASAAVQDVCWNLRPVGLDDLCLADCIRRNARRITKWSQFKLKIDVDPNLILCQEASTALLRILLESLTNIARHANAGKVKVSVLRNTNHAELIVHDDGLGIDMRKGSTKRTLGFLGMKERAAAVGGEVEFSSTPGKGTTVRFRVPLQLAELGVHLFPLKMAS